MKKLFLSLVILLVVWAVNAQSTSTLYASQHTESVTNTLGRYVLFSAFYRFGNRFAGGQTGARTAAGARTVANSGATASRTPAAGSGARPAASRPAR